MERVGKYKLEGFLGSGSFGCVNKAVDTLTGRVVAIKTVQMDRIRADSKLLQNLQMEIKILEAVKHPNLVSLIEVINENNQTHIVTEFCSEGDFGKYLRIKRSLPEAEAKEFFVQLASCLEHLWAKDIIHRDLKPDNILLHRAPSGKLVLKLADFGFARYIAPQSLGITTCGTPLYMAPEVLCKNQRYDSKVDVWSTGCILYQMLFGVVPFQAKNYNELIRLTLTASPKFPPETPISAECKDLLLKLLRPKAQDRISMTELLTHSFARGAEALAFPTSDRQKEAAGGDQWLKDFLADLLAEEAEPSLPSFCVPDYAQEVLGDRPREEGGEEDGYIVVVHRSDEFLSSCDRFIDSVPQPSPGRSSFFSSLSSLFFPASTSSSQDLAHPHPQHSPKEEEMWKEISSTLKRAELLAEQAKLKIPSGSFCLPDSDKKTEYHAHMFYFKAMTMIGFQVGRSIEHCREHSLLTPSTADMVREAKEYYEGHRAKLDALESELSDTAFEKLLRTRQYFRDQAAILFSKGQELKERALELGAEGKDQEEKEALQAALAVFESITVDAKEENLSFVSHEDRDIIESNLEFIKELLSKYRGPGEQP